jgi:hypothetical protein
MLFRNCSLLALLAIGLTCAGCSDGFQAHVTGQVIVDGKPAEKGSISFIPVNGDSPVTGDSDFVDGKYECPAPVGESKVEIRIPRKTGSKKLYDTPDSPVQDTFEEVLPAKFNSETVLRFKAEPGMNRKDWELSSGK